MVGECVCDGEISNLGVQLSDERCGPPNLQNHCGEEIQADASRALSDYHQVKKDEDMLRMSPYQVAELYSCGEISRDQVIAALTHREYAEGETRTTGLHDELLNYVPRSFDDVEAASLDGLIDDEIFAAALVALRLRRTESNDPR